MKVVGGGGEVGDEQFLRQYEADRTLSIIGIN